MDRKYIFFILLLLLHGTLSDSTGNKRLQFNEQGKFKIVQFTDLHYGYNEYENLQTSIVQDVILETEKPDLVIITGDLVSGYEWEKGDVGWFKSRWEQLVAPMIKHNIRWAIALGNHDVEGDLTGEQIAELDSSHELSLTQIGPKNISGATNYYLPIYKYGSTHFDDSDIGQVLWVFDSGNSGCLGVSGWGCIMYDQVFWYRNLSRTLAVSARGTPRLPIPSLAFFHIPLYEHLDLWNVQGVYGDLGEGEGVCCSSVNTGLYSAMLEMGDIKGVYCGHDHSNDYVGNYHGINLGFGRKTGYGCYGPPMGWKHGARVLEVTQNEFGSHSWLRLEDGSVEIQKLNSLSWRKFLGCCSMEGHGRVAMTWLNLLSLFLIIVAVVSVVSFLVRNGIRYYRQKKGRLLDSILGAGYYDASEGGSGEAEGVIHKLESKLTHLWFHKSPRPRLRRVNDLESIGV